MKAGAWLDMQAHAKAVFRLNEPKTLPDLPNATYPDVVSCRFVIHQMCHMNLVGFFFG